MRIRISSASPRLSSASTNQRLIRIDITEMGHPIHFEPFVKGGFASPRGQQSRRQVHRRSRAMRSSRIRRRESDSRSAPARPRNRLVSRWHRACRACAGRCRPEIDLPSPWETGSRPTFRKARPTQERRTARPASLPPSRRVFASRLTSNIRAGADKARRNCVTRNGAASEAAVATNAAQAKPASQGNAGHAQSNQNGELVVDVTVDGLEGKQQKDFAAPSE